MPDYSFIAQPQGANMNQLGSLMNNMNAVQNFRMNQLNLQQKQATLPADIAKVQAESSLAQQTLAPKVSAAQSEAQTAATGATSAAFKLQGAQAGVMLNEAGGLAADPVMQKDDPQGQIMAVRGAVQRAIAKGVPEWQAELQASHLIPLAQQPGAMYGALQNIVRANAGPGPQANIGNAPVSPVVTPTGAIAPLQLQPGAPGAIQAVPISAAQPNAGAAPGIIPPGINPAQQHTVGMNAQGQPYDITKNAQGQPTGISGVPVTNAPGATQPFVMPTNENADTLKIAQGIRQEANQAATSLPTTQAFANNAIQYAGGAVTGTGAQFLNELRGQYAGTPWTAPGVTDANLMGHALSQMTGSLIKATGLSTNQGQSLVGSQVADGNWTKTAIQTASREVRALSTGASLYSQGIENKIAQVAQTDPSASQFAARTFQNDWAKVADVNAFKLYDSLKNRQTDPGALTNPDKTGILDKLGGPTAKNPKGSILYQQTLQHIDAMKRLLTGQQ